MSLVPPNADALLVNAVTNARSRGGFPRMFGISVLCQSDFNSPPDSVQLAPTAISALRATSTLVQQLPTQTFKDSSLNATNSARTLSDPCFLLAIFNFMVLVYLSG